MCVSALVLAGISWMASGTSGCGAYGHVLGDYLRATAETPTMFRVWKFIDGRSFLCQIFGNLPRMVCVLTMSAAVVALGILRRGWRENRPLLWAAVLSA